MTFFLPVAALTNETDVPAAKERFDAALKGLGDEVDKLRELIDSIVIPQ